MKKAFTLLELIVVLVILGILATIATEILLKVYKNYAFTKATNSLAYKTDLVLNTIAAKLETRIPNTVIATECNISNNGCKDGNVTGFISISDLNASNASKYPVIEWINKDIYSRRGEWNDTLKRVVPGWAGFVDLNQTKINNTNGGDYNITIPYSDINITSDILTEYFHSWGLSINTADPNDVFNKKYATLIFSGADGRGDFIDINQSYGWYSTTAKNVYQIIPISKDLIRVKEINQSNQATVYEGFYISDGAFAIVPVYNAGTNDFNLTLKQNYFPWNDQNYTSGNTSLLVAHVTQFKFKEQNGLLRLYLCIQDPSIKINEQEKLTVCKERIVF